MAETTAEAPVTSEAEETQDTGEEGLEQFLVPEEEAETEFIPGEDTEPVEATSEEEVGDEKEEDPEKSADPASKNSEKKEEEKKEEPQLWTVKINGKEFDVDEQELIRGYQLGQAATQKFQEAAKLRGEAEQLVELLKNDPMKVLLHPAIGLNFRKLAEDYLLEQLKLEQADPTTRAQMEAERKFRELQEKNAELERRQHEEQIARETEVWRQKIDEAYTAALTNAKVPKTPTVVKRMAELNQEMLENGYDPTAQELVDLVRKEIIMAQREIVGQLPPEELEQYLGEEKMKAVRQADIAKVAAKPATKAQQVKAFKPAPTKAPKRYISERELNAHVRGVVGK